MPQLSVSYGILIDNTWPSTTTTTAKNNNNSDDSLIHHILPITKILTLPNTNDYFLTISRDGSLIWHDLLNSLKNIKLQIHSDWISDILYWDSDLASKSFEFISVSHDFSINFIRIYSTVDNNNNNDNNDNSYYWTYDWKIIGYHQDYIKCLQKLNHNTFVTIGLDNFINIWSVDNNNSTTLLKSFYNKEGSLYSLQCLPNLTVSNTPINLPFDIIVGDCNGNLLFYHSLKDDLIFKITAHNTNIKCIKLFFNHSMSTILLFSTCSNGVCNIWDLNDLKQPLHTFQWNNNAVIWSIEDHSSNTNNTSSTKHFLITDSKGYISKLSFNFDTLQYLIDLIYHDPNYNQRHPGILASVDLNNKLYFSYCSNSNLNIYNPSSQNLFIEKGGIALTRSSLLTNRRHVITENTDGIIQRWDIISCELIDTFDPKEGTFDDIVMKYTTNEILSHWCTVSIKVGILFVKVGPKFTNTEIYGSAFKGYEFLNSNSKNDLDKKSKEKRRHKYYYSHLHSNKNSDNENSDNDDINNNNDSNTTGYIINEEVRYNLGKVVLISLFHEFIKWEINKDIRYREKLLASIDNSNMTTNSLVTNDPNINSNSDNNITSISNKQRKKNAFTSLSIATSHFRSKDSSANHTPFVSAPSTPQNEVNMNLRDYPNGNNNYNIYHHKSHENLLSNTLLEDSELSMSPTGSKPNSRTLSSGSLFTRKFKSFRNNSTSVNDISASGNNKNDSTRASVCPGSVSLERSQSIPVSNAGSQINFNHKIFQKQDPSHDLLTEPSTLSALLSKNETKKSHQFLNDLISEIHESYKEGLQTQSLTLSKFGLTKRKIVSQLKTNEELPIIKVKSNTLLLVQSWNEGSCGGKVLFSTLLPISTSQSPFYLQSFSSPALSRNQSTNSLISTSTSISSLDNFFDKCTISSQTSKHSSVSSSDSLLLPGDDNVITLKKEKLLNRQQHHANKKLFTKIERNLPYWMGVLLFKDDTVVQEKQPKLNFVIVPWVPEFQQDEDVQTKNNSSSSAQHHYYSGFKLGKSKSNDIIKNSMTDLPKISDSNIKLIAPGMIKVKKIKNYVVDRFESKTPEMKDKIDPSIWIELLCKGNVLDNDMTLSTVRTLYWKSPGEIKIQYRRKVSH